MNINKFTQNSLQAVQNCEKIAMDYGNQELAQEHLLYALLTQDDSLIAKLMEKMGLDKNMVINRVEESLRKLPKVQGGQQYVAPVCVVGCVVGSFGISCSVFSARI